MDLGDFDKDKMQASDNKYIKQISPSLDTKTFIEHSQQLYKIAIKDLHEHNFKIEDSELQDIYKNALLYFRGDERSSWDLTKGIFAVGGTGSGKTIFFEIFKRYTLSLNANSFVKAKQLKIIASVAKEGINEVEKFIKDGTKPIILYIDDFGSGNSVINHFGTNFDVLDELMQGRYDEFIYSGALTHLTTNVMPSEFKEKFNERIVSRFSQMFNVVLFPNNDYRKP